VLLFIDKNRGKKEGDMDFFDKLEKAKGMYEMFAVLYEYRYPLLLVVVTVATVLIVRSYLHGRDITKLKKVTGVRPGGSSDGQTSIHIENAYFLQTTPQDAKLLMKGEQPRLLQLPEGKIICPQCHRENPSDVGMCLYCDQVFFLRNANVATSVANVSQQTDFLACSSCGKQNFVYHRFCRLCGKPLQPTNANRQEATTVCSHCDYARKANWHFCGYCGKPPQPTPNPRFNRKPGLDILD
jgi:hypothetical protein